MKDPWPQYTRLKCKALSLEVNLKASREKSSVKEGHVTLQRMQIFENLVLFQLGMKPQSFEILWKRFQSPGSQVGCPTILEPQTIGNLKFFDTKKPLSWLQAGSELLKSMKFFQHLTNLQKRNHRLYFLNIDSNSSVLLAWFLHCKYTFWLMYVLDEYMWNSI